MKTLLVVLSLLYTSVSLAQTYSYEYGVVNLSPPLGANNYDLVTKTQEFQNVVNSKAAGGFEYVSAVPIPPNRDPADRPYAMSYLILFRKINSPAQEYLESLASKVDGNAQKYLDAQLTVLRMKMLDEINKVTGNTLSQSFREELQKYLIAQIELLCSDLRTDVTHSIQSGAK